MSRMLLASRSRAPLKPILATTPKDNFAAINVMVASLSVMRRCRQIEDAETRPSMTAPATIRRVAFQGERGAFSEEAAVSLLGENIEAVPRPSFDALFSSIQEG